NRLAVVGERPDRPLLRERFAAHGRGLARACGLRFTERAGHCFRPTRPARHADRSELRERALEERRRAGAIARRVAADVHHGLVVVDQRAERAGPLLVEDGARLPEPFACFVMTALERTEPGEREAAVGVRIPKIRTHRLRAEVALENLGVVAA